jgi:hypothetical protein
MEDDYQEIQTEFLHCLSILSKKLTKFQYELVCQVIFNLYMGKTYGFDPAFDERFMPLVRIYWYSKGKNNFKEKNISKTEKNARVFTVYDGGKTKK